jgi:hypothetical protein
MQLILQLRPCEPSVLQGIAAALGAATGAHVRELQPADDARRQQQQQHASGHALLLTLQQQAGADADAVLAAVAALEAHAHVSAH